MSVWFVTGASRGFGAEIFKEALARGNQVIATARKPVDIPFSGDNLLALALDVRMRIRRARRSSPPVQSARSGN